jgi:hypothetical protein
LPRDHSDESPEAEQSPQTVRQRIRKALHEPLLLFLLIGAAIFMLYLAVTPRRAADPGSRIELTEDDMRQIELGWTVKWKRPPTPAEWNDLVEDAVREEVLYREALKLGLDQDDTIVRRRLGQKLEFLMEDVSALRDPTTPELKAWYGQHGAQFALPGRVTFCHAYFSPDSPGGQAEARARAALAQLRSNSSCGASASIGDRFPDYDYYANRSPDDVANVFGTQFAEGLFRLRPGGWQGPVESGLGWHLILVEALTPGRVPAFDEVPRAEVESAWQDDQRAQAKRKAYQAMRARYEVALPKSPAS